KNMKNSKVILNAPPARTSKGGYLLNEVSSTIKKVVVRITNRIGIEQVKIFNKTIEFPIEYKESGIEDIYKSDESSSFNKEFSIEIISNEGIEEIEITAVETHSIINGGQ
ncbi:MAG: hypothetical protein ACRC0V_05540, partial [Fusobacteriaceae bacterium]